MKKFLSLLIALVLSVFSAIGIADVTPVDRPSDIKVVEWAVGYSRRCRNHRKVQPRNWTPVVRRIALAPMRLLIGTALADTTPDERFWSMLAKGGTKEEATAAYNAVDESEIEKPKARRVSHPHWAKVDPERVGFLTTECLQEATAAKRGWFSAGKLNGFDGTTILVYQWFRPNDPEAPKEPPKKIKFKDIEYILWCASQGGVKKGAAIYVTRKFLYTETEGKKNKDLLNTVDGLPINRINQIRALRLTA